MHGFDLEQLHTFVAVVDAGSLTAAAPRVFLSQSSVSEQIRKLEQRAGTRLLSRGKGGVATTAAGDRLLAHARQILALSDTALRDLRGQELRGELRLAVTDYFRPGDIPRVLRNLGAQYPQLRVNVTIGQSDLVERGCKAGEFDIGLSMRAVERPGGVSGSRRALLLRREPLLWVAAPASRMHLESPLPLVLLPSSCQLHRLALRLLQRQNIPCVVAHTASGVAGLQGALAAGLGIGCINQSAVAEGMLRLGAREGLPPLPQAEFHLLPRRRDEAPVVTQAREALLAQFL